MAGMPANLTVGKRKVPPVGDDFAPNKRVANNGATPQLPDRDGPAKSKKPTPKVQTSEKAKKSKGPDIKGMRNDIKKMGTF